MSTLHERKIDCHNHILDPQRYPYGHDTKYRPSAQEIATEHQLHTVCDTYGVDHCLVVGPNSGYGNDNSYLLDAIARSHSRFKGIAVVPNDADTATLAALKARGIVGIAVNATYHSVEYYLDIAPLLRRLTELAMYVQVQVESDQLTGLLPLLMSSDVNVLVDHCGRPDASAGLQQPGFAALLSLAKTRRASVKLSGIAKFSQQDYPYQDAWPFVRALVDAFGLDNCMWGSDWPFLRAPSRVDYGPLLTLVDQLFPSETDRHKLLWQTPSRLFGFPAKT